MIVPLTQRPSVLYWRLSDFTWRHLADFSVLIKMMSDVSFVTLPIKKRDFVSIDNLKNIRFCMVQASISCAQFHDQQSLRCIFELHNLRGTKAELLMNIVILPAESVKTRPSRQQAPVHIRSFHENLVHWILGRQEGCHRCHKNDTNDKNQEIFCIKKWKNDFFSLFSKKT